ncbi:Phosphatidate phosphatase APP1 [Deinococcus reticulitermitis]|uniref:Phosphatidate phosphatase APP1 n=1 Tax=Deinococcus reticulitermitis TaxID=856736 RepID=A0A1H7BRY1_9DEIO|nr:App1 family protein [Deinococcus reticulitermitis]SEJ79946.1 Phosphatidate phosphatase APP1 [Deinococcus reticulitermitis]
MNPAKTAFKTLLPVIERTVLSADRSFTGYIQPRRLRGKLIMQPYVGWGTPEGVELTGRVLLPRTVRPARKGDPRWRNFRNVLRRLLSREVGGVRVVGVLDGQNASAVSDSDGYFTLTFTPQAPLTPGWHEATLTMEGREEKPTRARVQVIGAARFGIISDLDDTVIQSDVTSLPRMLMTSLTGNSRTRSPFPGVGAFYRALTREGEARNPIFYVSSSPWNFFDLLWQFLEYRRIPLGPLFLRNWGMDLLGGHGGYKHGVIERILQRYPELGFVLVGDSGEKDPEIYAEVVRRFPGRVLAVYIRDVTAGERDEGVMKLREEVRKAGVDLVLTPDSLNAAGHAMAMGLITPGEYRSVLTSVARTYET